MRCLEACKWKRERVGGRDCYYCEICGRFSRSRPTSYIPTDDDETKDEIKDETKDETNSGEEKCVHVWICLRDRCHNRGNGKYYAYKCSECGKFQRRS